MTPEPELRARRSATPPAQRTARPSCRLACCAAKLETATAALAELCNPRSSTEIYHRPPVAGRPSLCAGAVVRCSVKESKPHTPNLCRASKASMSCGCFAWYARRIALPTEMPSKSAGEQPSSHIFIDCNIERKHGPRASRPDLVINGVSPSAHSAPLVTVRIQTIIKAYPLHRLHSLAQSAHHNLRLVYLQGCTSNAQRLESLESIKVVWVACNVSTKKRFANREALQVS
jgi:hypothetical protein